MIDGCFERCANITFESPQLLSSLHVSNTRQRVHVAALVNLLQWH